MSGTLPHKAPRAHDTPDAATKRLRWSPPPQLGVLWRPPQDAMPAEKEPVLTPEAARAFLRRAEWSFRPPPG